MSYDPQTEDAGDMTCDWPVDDDNDCGAYASWHSFPGTPTWVECEEGHRYTIIGNDDGVPVILELQPKPDPADLDLTIHEDDPF